MSALHVQAVEPRSDEGDLGTSADPASTLWDAHFGDPAAALARVRSVLAAPDRHDERTLAWAELTQGFDRLSLGDVPSDLRAWLDRAGERFLKLADRRGALLVDVGRARLLIHEQQPLAAREILDALYADARRELGVRDRYWIISALCTTYYDTEQIGEAIRCMYEALGLLRTIEMSPQLGTVLSNLAATLVMVGDFDAARELAQEAVELLAHYRNRELVVDARSNLAEALLGMGDREGALATVEMMLADLDPSRLSPRNHYCSIAAELFALFGRIEDAERVVALAAEIFAGSPNGSNEVHLRWAEACVAAARDPGATGLAAMAAVMKVATQRSHLTTLCKVHAAMAERYAALGRFEEAWRAQRALFDVAKTRLVNRASAQYYLLRGEHELSQVRAERDRALAQRQESEALNRQLEQVNAELSRKMRQVEELQSRLAREAVHDPLTQLFNRRYLDSTMPGLIGAAQRRGTPLTLALVDLDYFKLVNDRHGHQAGDEVLRQVGRLFSSALRPSDVVARWGGEEFCIVFPDTAVAGAATALAALAAKLRQLEVSWAGAIISGFTFSAALAAYDLHGRTLDELVSAADCDLYAAKGAGRDRILVARG